MKNLDYLILGVVFIFGLVAFMFFSSVPHYQRNVVYVTSAAYFLWSLYHHYRLGDLSVSIVIEYLIMILLVIVVLSGTFV